MAVARGPELLTEARARGVDVRAETCPQYLLLDDELFKRPDGHRFATCPPVRTPPHQEALWAALADSTLDVLATDTCSFTSAQKDLWEGDYRKIPFGMPGIELLLPLTFTTGVGTGRFSLERMVEILCERPAQLFGLWPRKGTLTVGSDADVVVFDPAAEVTVTASALASRCDYNPYEGMVMRGWPLHTLVRGRFVVRDRNLSATQGTGRFVPRGPLR